MSQKNKPRVVKDYEKLDVEIQEQIKLFYPLGFERKLIKFTNAEGKLVSALPFETDEKYYLVRMTLQEAKDIVEDDDDYDDDGNLRTSVREEYEDKYDDEEIEIDEDLDDDED
jgi:hypothetical protein